ncbi:hypothetical protein HS088_TW09G00815 [Tripterygium wilfordii]|uniref:Transmembrane protein n=1 Tax=Tripterygium wilfordii TaxID=458696 RepID=A0A7J7D8Q9_TRIWF|nr:PAMP-induced secreted peptide 1 [Tripterygium wilfordii]KAF5742755.1 hypothetical protein HS088_TW09G00815 [Tripterygium wilfordii]
MKTSTTTTLLIILMISVAILNHVGVVDAARVLSESEDFASANHLKTYSSSSSVYEKAKTTMACWLQRLASGPSPRGPGH